jgi:hypothetical protein
MHFTPGICRGALKSSWFYFPAVCSLEGEPLVLPSAPCLGSPFHQESEGKAAGGRKAQQHNMMMWVDEGWKVRFSEALCYILSSTRIDIGYLGPCLEKCLAHKRCR